MTFPSSSGSRSFGLSSALNSAQAMAAGVKAQGQALSALCAAGAVAASSILTFTTMLADAKVLFNKCAAVAGLEAYAQAQVGDLDIASEFTAMLAAIDATTAWVVANFPKDSTNTFLMVTSFASDNTGRTQQRQFTPAQTAGLKTVVDALVATID